MQHVEPVTAKCVAVCKLFSEHRRSFRIQRPSSFSIFRTRNRETQDYDASQEVAPVIGEQAAGEEPEEKPRIGVLEIKDRNAIYNISSSDEEINPLSKDYIGIIANYFSVGIMIGGCT